MNVTAPQTIRDYIKRRVWRAVLIVFAGFLVWSQLMPYVKADDFYVLGLGFLLVIVPSIVLPQMIRCPRCSHRLGPVAKRIAFSLFGFWRMSHCPYCGVDLDETMPGKPIP